MQEVHRLDYTQKLLNMFLVGEDKENFQPRGVIIDGTIILSNEFGTIFTILEEERNKNKLQAEEKGKEPDFSTIKYVHGNSFELDKIGINDCLDQSYKNGFYARQGVRKIGQATIGGAKTLVLSDDAEKIKQYIEPTIESNKTRAIEQNNGSKISVPITFFVSVENQKVYNNSCVRPFKQDNFYYMNNQDLKYAVEEINNSIDKILQKTDKSPEIEL